MSDTLNPTEPKATEPDFDSGPWATIASGLKVLTKRGRLVISEGHLGLLRENGDRYIKRMQELETIATGFTGVQQAFAIQAGREVRIIASARDTTDESAAKICRDIARAFEEQLTYPGEIKVTLIRETRISETAR